MTDGHADTRRQLIPTLASVARVKTGVRMNATDVTGLCAAAQYGLIMFTLSRRTEFRHDGKTIGRNAELRTVWLSKNRNRTVQQFSADP